VDFRDDDMYAPETYKGVGGLLGRLSAMTGQVGSDNIPTADRPGLYAPEAFGNATAGLIERIRELQQQQAGYRPGVTSSTSAMTNRIVGAESGGRANAANERSTALGAGQFIRGTWLDLLARYRPDLTGTPDELAALRTDPKLSAEMVEHYTAENAKGLSRAGHAATPGNLYLSHFAGPSGALKVLAADPTASVRSVLGERAVASNPFLDKMTVGDLRAWADRKMRAQPQASAKASPFPDHADPVFGVPAFPSAAARPQKSRPVQPPIFFPF